MGYGPTNDTDSIHVLRKAFDVGINYFDTAPLYGHGNSEILLRLDQTWSSILAESLSDWV